jgi:hypothetical protein
MVTAFKVNDIWSPRFIDTKDGRKILARPHVATFRGKHNASKSKVFIVLYSRQYQQPHSPGLTLPELATYSGVSYSYIKTRLAKWCLWGYLKREKCVSSTRKQTVYTYVIADRGRHFVLDRIPKAIGARFVTEIQEHQNKK